MSKPRTLDMPGGSPWDSFFDKDVQSVLMLRFSAPPLSPEITEALRCEFLAWPVVAHTVVDSFAQDRRNKILRQSDFLLAYAEDRQFVAELLMAVTRYHETPEGDQRLARRVADCGNRMKPADESNFFTDCFDGLVDWKFVARQLGCKNSIGQLMTEWHREVKRRNNLLKRWEEQIEAYATLTDGRRKRGEPPLPLQGVTFQ
jgi:hypothetical protein